MNRGIILLLGGVVVFGLLALYALERGPVLLLQPPSVERIAFISDRGGNTDVWTMRTDGSDKQQVTHDSSDDQLPIWSPDGKEIISISDRRNQVYQVFLNAWDGRYVNPLTFSEGTKDSPVWSSDGREIVFISGGKVFFKRRDGGREEQLLPPLGTVARGWSPYIYASWSPDGEYLLYAQETDYGMEAHVLHKSDARAWEDRTDQSIGISRARYLEAAWIPNAPSVVVSFIDRNGENGILVADLDAREAYDIHVFEDFERGPGAISISPDGQKIAFEVWRVNDGIRYRPQGIYVIDADGSDPRPIIQGHASEPTWSPDGKQIACTVMDSTGIRDIWRVSVDGSEKINLTNGEGDSYHPAWSPSL